MKEVMACDVSPVAMFYNDPSSGDGYGESFLLSKENPFIARNLRLILRNTTQEDLELSAISPSVLDQLWFPDVEIRFLPPISRPTFNFIL